MKNKYVLEIIDEFGFKIQRFYFCSEKKIKQILFHEYILLKAKAVKRDKYQKRCCKLYRKGILRDKQFDFFNIKPSIVKTEKVNDTYRVVLKVGFTLNHTLSYKKLSPKAKYQVVEENMYEKVYHGFCNSRVDASRMASKIARKHLLKSTTVGDIVDEEAICKRIIKNKIKYSFSYWYRSSYEYDEWDITVVCIYADKINFQIGA